MFQTEVVDLNEICILSHAQRADFGNSIRGLLGCDDV
jgi:hypothetical protein